MKRILIVLTLIIIGGIFLWWGDRHLSAVQTSTTTSFLTATTVAISPQTTSPQQTTTTHPAGGLPASYLIKNVPFTIQAPHQNWDQTHEEACEEAAVLQAAWYAKGKRMGKIDPDIAEAELQQIIAWEKQNFGFFEDTNAAQTAQIAKGYYGLNAKVYYDITASDIKKQIAAGRPVVVLAAGRLLGNPNFRGAGPVYHALTVIGYGSGYFITNDPGTRKGQGYKYKEEVLMKAVHEWAGSPDNILQGRKNMIVITS